CARPRTGYW
nr:immunoglobulin heavy chain junction region [Mus musculus]